MQKVIEQTLREMKTNDQVFVGEAKLNNTITVHYVYTWPDV